MGEETTAKDVMVLLTARVKSLQLVQKQINNVYKCAEDPTFSDVGVMTAMLGELVTLKDKFTRCHYEVADELDPESTDAKDLHKNADDAEAKVTKCYDEGQSWIAERSGAPDAPTVGKRPAEPGGSRTQPPAAASADDMLKAILDLRSVVIGKPTEIDRLSTVCDDRNRMIDYLEDQRESERSSFHLQVSKLEKELHEARRLLSTRGSSTPAHPDSDHRGVTFRDHDISRVTDEESEPDRGTERRNFDETVRRVASICNTVNNAHSNNHNVHVSSGSNVSAADSETSVLSTLVSQNNDLVKTFIRESRSNALSRSESEDIPRTKLSVFGGDPLEYWSFVKTFDELIGTSSKRASKKLNTLINHCTPEVKVLIESCTLLSADSGYVKARAILKAKFGNPFIISQAWKVKLYDHQKAATPELLLSFSNDLVCCQTTLTELKYLSDLDNVDTLSRLVSRLPNYLRSKWRKIHQAEMKDGGVGRLSKFVDMVVNAAEESNDAIYNDSRLDMILSTQPVAPISKLVPGSQIEVGTGARGKVKFEGGRKPSIFATSATRVDRDDDQNALDEFDRQISVMTAEFKNRVCSVCGDGHYTSTCSKYLAMPPDKRLVTVREKRLCILCLGKDHFIQKCRQTWRCQVKGCEFRHHSSLHGSFNLPNTTEVKESEINVILAGDTDVSDSESDVSINVTCVEQESYVFQTVTIQTACLPVVPVVVCGPKGLYYTYALIDTGSNSTLCSERLSAKIGLVHKGVTSLHVNSVVGSSSHKGGVYDFQVKGIDSGSFLPLFEAVSIPELPISDKHILTGAELETWEHLEGLNLPNINVRRVDLLLGQDNAHLIKPGVRIDGDRLRDPYAVSTPLGWTVWGFTGPKNDEGSVCDNVEERSINFTEKRESPFPTLEESVDRFWRLDKVPGKSMLSEDDQKVMSLWDSSIKIVDGHIELPIPFKDDDPVFPDNRHVVLARLKALGARLAKDNNLNSQYTTAMNANFTKGYAEKVISPVFQAMCWYLTQLPVSHKRKPGVVRPVFNGGFVFKGVSLNGLVHQGPDQTNRLIDVLLNFRVFEVAFMADIKSMYNQVRVPPEQRDCMRFLYWEDGDVNKPVIDCHMNTHAFGAIWSPSACCYALSKVPELLGVPEDSEVAVAIKRGFYVDDCLRSVMNVIKAIRLLLGMRSLLQQVSFHLTKVASNSVEVLQSVPEEDRAMGEQCLNLSGGKLHTEHSLGQGWKPGPDMFTFAVKFLLDPKTRREFLSTVSSLFDPLGLCAPFIIPAKRLLQELTKRGLGWDDLVPKDVMDQWARWVRDANTIEQFQVPRWLGYSGECQRAQLHHFADASEVAYGCASYFCVINESGMIVSSVLLMSRCKVSPTKTASIPRLELCAAFLASQADEALRQYLDVSLLTSQFWSDSALVLRYLNTEPSRFKTFVANRVAGIMEVSNRAQWHFVPGADNPADLVSRGLSASELVDNRLWKHGPDFLLKGIEFWPEQPDFVEIDGDCIEVKRAKAIYSCQTKQEACEVDIIETVVDRAGSWLRAVRVVATIFVAIRRFKNPSQEPRLGEFGVVDVSLLKKAEERIFEYIQKRHLTQEILSSKAIVKLNPVIREGMYHVGGRLGKGTFAAEFKHPYIIPPGNRAIELFITHAHNQVYHGGVERTTMEVRKTVWVVTGKKAVRGVIKSCMLCKKYKAPHVTQMMADLPTFRLSTNVPPFTFVGVDYFGPFQIKQGRSFVKRYCCAFICSVIRAGHVEVAVDLSASSFINALSRFIARRGKPTHILSDNGTNFVGSKSELDKANVLWNSELVAGHCASKGIDWQFNPPSASNFGGLWERQIRTLRSSILYASQGVTMTDEAFRTIVGIAEQMFNSRPMGKLSEDSEELTPLTPSHLLNLRCTENVSGVFCKQDALRASWKQCQVVADKFWARWTEQYLSLLQERQKWLKSRTNIKKGDLVLVVNDQTHRFQWPLGLIVQAFPGSDGLVRSVTVKTHAGIYSRPVNKLVLLEAEFE